MVVITNDFEFNIIDLECFKNIMKGSLYPAAQNMESTADFSSDSSTSNVKLLSAQLTKGGLLILLKIEVSL